APLNQPSMKRLVLVLLVCLCAASVFIIARSRGQASQDARAAAITAEEQVFAGLSRQFQLEWPWRTEAEWVTADIAGAIPNIAHFATDGQAAATGVIRPRSLPTPPPLPARMELRLPRGDITIVELPDHIWAPAAYEPLARQLLGRTGSRCDAGDGAGLVATLLQPPAAIIPRENLRGPDLLERHPPGPPGHH